MGAHRKRLEAREAYVGLLGHGALEKRVNLGGRGRVLHRLGQVGQRARGRPAEGRVGEERREEVADHGQARERRVRAYSVRE